MSIHKTDDTPFIDPTAHIGPGMARLLGLPQPSTVHLATCEMLGIYPYTPRAWHVRSLLVGPAMATQPRKQ